MSVKHALLALLSAQPSSTYQLRGRFEVSTAQSWPLNIGQVSTTLQRLERDGLVLREGDPADPEATGQPWRLTAAGQAELEAWWGRPVVAEHRGRDELVVKFMLATITPGVDMPALLQTQRAATQRDMHDLTRLRRGTTDDDLVGRLVLDHHIFIAEAELRWLDDVEASLERSAAHEQASRGGSYEIRSQQVQQTDAVK
ncbi:MAG: PadR family transcriptional regulator [Brooklawnia sp.]|jgi:DNA-binding PadR family transcriptional regulator